MSVDHLAPQIRRILRSSDLSTVSAKHVRKQLLELNPDVTLEYIKENKEAIDALIGGIFEGMNNPQAGVGVGIEPAHTTTGHANGKRKREEDAVQDRVDEDEQGDDSQGEDEQENGDDEEDRSPTTPVSKKQKKSSKAKEITDEEYARQLSSELNQRPSRGRNANTNGTSKKGASRTPKKVKKSRAHIDDDSDADDSDEGSSRKRKPTKKKAGGGGGAKGGFAKEFVLSEPLAAVLNVPQLSRPQVVKKLWEYIKGNELQNPRNKKEILCDDGLRAVFNSDKIDMFAMNKILGQHLYEPDS